MTLTQIILVLLTVLGLSIGQVLFKLAAQGLPPPTNWSLAILVNKKLILALVVYTGTTLMWLAVLRKTPLQLAYPFIALVFVFVPLVAHFALGEPLHGNIFIGAGVILVGVWISVYWN